MSERESSEESIFSSNSDSSTEDESSGREDTDIKDEETTETSETANKQPHDAREERSRRKRRNESEQKKKKRAHDAVLNATYSDLLDDATREDSSNFDDDQPSELSGSAIGASYWTAQEKVALNRALSQHGQDNLPLLARSVPSKSELEVRAYLLLLQDMGTNVPSDKLKSTETPPAAIEIPPSCHKALNRIARDYADQAYALDIEHEMERYGDLWIIDDDFITARALSDTSDESREDLTSETPDAFHLLEPQTFLQLSRTLFMNNLPDTSNNWRTIGETDLASPTPALFRSAFEDLHEITINLTRRVIQASLAQAQSRLHAKDDNRSDKKVTRQDVDFAFHALYPRIDRKRYWATVARRCGVQVYSRSKHKGGDTGKLGVLLSYDDVEAELGYPRSSTVGASQHGSAGLAETSELASTSDNLTESESDDSETPATVETHGTTRESSDGDETGNSNSPDTESDNDEDLEILDQQASLAEDKRLRELLDLPSLPQSTVEETRPLEHRPRKRRDSEESVQWRKRVKYEAEWERQGA